MNRIILLTPNEGLSQQHLREFEAAGIEAEMFDKDGPRLVPQAGSGDSGSHPAAGRDGREDHRHRRLRGQQPGAGGRGAPRGQRGRGRRMDAARNALCEKGFSFEYSATFGQAVAGKPKLIDLYAKSILFNYSLSLLLRRWLRQGLPDPEPGRRNADRTTWNSIWSPVCCRFSSSSGCIASKERRSGRSISRSRYGFSSAAA